MPSYGSNDGYGRQKLSARPSTKLTDIGKKQVDSSRMASLLAEEDIRPVGDPASNVATVDPSAAPDVQWFQASKLGDVACLKRLHNERPVLLMKAARGEGHTALHWACAAGHLSSARFLIEQGTPVSVRNRQESTPLHCAAAAGQLELVQELMQRGAHVAAQDSCGKTAADLARLSGHSEVVAALQAR